MSDRTECIQAAERLLDSPNQRRAVVARLDDYLGQLFGEFDVAAFPALDVLTGEPGIGLLGRLGADEFFGNVSDVFRGLGGSLEFKRRVLRALPIPLASGGCAQFAEVLWPREGGDDWLREFVEIKFAEPQVWDRLTTPRGIAQLEPEQRDWGHELEQAAIRRLEHQPDADDVGQHVALRFLATKRSALAANRQAARRVRVLCDGDQSDTRTLADLYSWQGAPQELADVAPRLSNRYPEDVRDAVGRALADFDVDGLLDLISGVEEPSTAVVTWVQELSTKNPDFLRVLRATRYRTVSGEYLPFAEVRTVHDTDRQKVLELAPRKILDWDFYPNLREHLAQNNSLPQPLIPVRRAGGTDVTPTLHAEPEQAPSEVQLELLEFGPAEVRAEDGNHGSESGLHVGFPELGGRAIQTACPHQLDAAACLNKISEWWEDNRERLLREYDEETYPDPGIFEHLRPPYGGEPHRKAWLTLVLRARLESFGQVKPGQNRGFVELFINQGWLDAISEQGAGNDLVTSLRRYISRDAEEVPYAAWLAPLLSVFLVSPWLDDYVRTLLAMNLQDGDVDPAQFLTPAANQAVARGVAAAPPLFPFLGIGACFLFRELKRKGVLTHPSLDSACYVPTRAVRRALSWLGAEGLRDDRGNRLEQSGAVRRFLGKHLGDNADFGGAFDLPLRIALRNGRWRELTGIEIELGDDAEAPEDPDRGGPPG
ncbi:MAG: hypothetical protein IT377_18495 [Polyangiaceae bacterium]|nr:hypothetical protein [Polyangiaceae bacterium]